METPKNIKTETTGSFIKDLFNNKKILWVIIAFVAVMMLTLIFNDTAREAFLERRGNIMVREIDEYKIRPAHTPIA